LSSAPSSFNDPSHIRIGIPFGLPHLIIRGGSSTAVPPQSSRQVAARIGSHSANEKTNGSYISGKKNDESQDLDPRNGKFEVPHYEKALNKLSSITTPFSTNKVTRTPEKATQTMGKLSAEMTSAVALESHGSEQIPVEYVAETDLPTELGHYRLRAYRIQQDWIPSSENFRKLIQHMGTEPCVIYCTDFPPGSIAPGQQSAEFTKNVPVRIHDQCFTSEVFLSQRCDCKEQLQMSLKYIQEHGGAVIYLQQEGRGIGLANKVAAYALQDSGMDTVDANTHLGFPEDSRQYGVVPGILRDMGIDSIQLMTNNPYKIDRLRQLGVKVEGTIPMVVNSPTAHNRRYLETKVERMNHTDIGAILQSSDEAQKINGQMLPRRRRTFVEKQSDESLQMPGQFDIQIIPNINQGATTAARAVTSALFADPQETGVKAKEDGYCFGKQSVEDAIAAIKRGEMVVVVDDEGRENEGDFIAASDLVTPRLMAEMVRYTSGVICVAMEGDRMDALELPAMVGNNQDPKGTAFSVTVDAAPQHGISTGISATDRAKTIRLLSDPSTTPGDFVRPGHIFPLRAREGGTLVRDGHTEASVDLARLAGLNPSGVLCEIVSEENPVEMARLPELKRFCQKHGYVMTSIVDIAQYRREMGL